MHKRYSGLTSRTRSHFVAVPVATACAVALAVSLGVGGCGDDETGGSGGGTASSVASTSASTDAVTATVATSTVATTATSSTGSGGPSGIGDPCTASMPGPSPDCASDQICLPDSVGLPGGYCSETCDPGQCPADATCIPVGGMTSLCFKQCMTVAECRTGYDCDPGAQVCVPTGQGGDLPPGTNNGLACDMPIVAPPGLGALFGTDQLISGGTGSMFDAEVEVAADPAHSRVVVAWIAVLPSTSAIGIAISDNDGATFSTPDILPAAGDPVDMSSAQSDPVVAVDPAGNFYVSWVGYDPTMGQPQNMIVYVAKALPGGTFDTITKVSPPGEWVQNGFLDKPWIAASPVDGSLYVTWSRATTTTQDMRMARSIDGGATWASPITFSDNADLSKSRNLAQVVVAPDGKPYATWVEIGAEQFGSTSNQIFLQRFNTDGTKNGPNVLVTGGTDSPSFDDPTVTAFGSNVYVGFISGNPTGAWDMRVAASLDGGATWQPAVKANDDATCATHFHHQIFADANGAVHLAYYDNRYLVGNVFHQSSPPAQNGTPLSFGAATFVNSQTFPFTTSRSSPGWLGDYLGFWIAGSTMYSAWSDPRVNGSSEIYFARGPVP